VLPEALALLFFGYTASIAADWVLFRRTAEARVMRALMRGEAASKSGDHVEAERWFRRGLAIAERRFGRGTWRTALGLVLVGQALAAQDRLDVAEEWVARALAAQPIAPGRSNSQFARVYVIAAHVAALRRDMGERRARLEKGRVFALQGDPAALAMIDAQMVSVLRQVGDDQAAIEKLKTLDPRSISAGEFARLGRSRLLAGDGASAAELLSHAVELERERGDVSGNLALLRSLLAEASELSGARDEAKRALTASIDTYDALSAPAMVVIPLLVKLARLEVALGSLAAAEDACRRALDRARPGPRTTEPYRTAAPNDPLAASLVEAEHLLAELIARGQPSDADGAR
jgi:tetratricopeptide (TPR) repeat protein